MPLSHCNNIGCNEQAASGSLRVASRQRASRYAAIDTAYRRAIAGCRRISVTTVAATDASVAEAFQRSIDQSATSMHSQKRTTHVVHAGNKRTACHVTDVSTTLMCVCGLDISHASYVAHVWMIPRQRDSLNRNYFVLQNFWSYRSSTRHNRSTTVIT